MTAAALPMAGSGWDQGDPATVTCASGIRLDPASGQPQLFAEVGAFLAVAQDYPGPTS